MSDTATLTGPALNASNSDPGFTPPAAPPVNASNSPADQAGGAVGEISPADQAAAAAARSGADQTAKPAEAAPETKTEEPPAEDNTPPAIKREITKERNRRREAEAKMAEFQQELTRQRELHERTVAALEALKPKAPDPMAEPRPTRDTFDSPEAYDMALEGWSARRAEAATTARLAEEARVAREAEAAEAARKAAETEAQTVQRQWQEKAEKARDKFPDFDEVSGADVAITNHMADAILRADNGPEIAYHLGQHPDVAARIAALPSVGAQLFEMGKLAATLAQPAPVRVSSAPAPITPLPASREAATNVDREESMEEVAARVAKREAAGRRPVFGTRA